MNMTRDEYCHMPYNGPGLGASIAFPGRLKCNKYLSAGVPPQPMNFSSYINEESIRNVDLVNWVTLGALDVPTSESAPVTSINGRALSFWLLPYNYFDQVR